MSTPRQASKLIVFDRDGTLIRHVPYLCDPAQVELLPGVREGLSQLKLAGHKLFLHTNQSGVGRGYFPIEAAIRCNEELIRKLDFDTNVFEEICISPESPQQVMAYRKPSPRFGCELLARYRLAPADMWYIGDNLTDLLTASNIGCQGVGVNTGVHDLDHELTQAGLTDKFAVCQDFAQVTARLLQTMRESA